MIKRLFIILLVSLLSWDNLFSQTFNYNFQVIEDDTLIIPESDTPTPLTCGADWGTLAVKIPIGFNFPFLGTNFDSLVISNGALTFDVNSNFVFAFTGVSLKTIYKRMDTIPENDSLITKIYVQNTLTSCQIIFRHAGLQSEMNFGTWIDFKIELYNNGTIEMHFGANELEEAQSLDYNIVCGLLNRNASDEQQIGLLVGGSHETIEAVVVNNYQNHPGFSFWPSNGTIYRFIPN